MHDVRNKLSSGCEIIMDVDSSKGQYMKTKPAGRVYTSNPKGLLQVQISCERLLITRAGYDIKDTKRIADLAPSPELFRKYLKEWRGTPPDKWWPRYEERFLEELKTEEKVCALRKVFKRLLVGQDVVLVCFCNDHRFCHRRLVGEFLANYGAEVTEISPAIHEQTYLL